MGGKPKYDLNPKQWKALELLEKGLSRKEVCREVGFSVEYLDDLIHGKIEKTTHAAPLFKQEYLKIQKKQEEDTKRLVKENTKTAQEIAKKVLADLSLKPKLTPVEKKLIPTYLNALSKCTPSVSVSNVSYSYTKGLTPEELIHEFKRLKSVAESSFERRAIQNPPQGGPGSLPQVDE